MLRYVFNLVLQCFVEGSLFICFLVPCFQWPFLYPPASKSCGPQVSDPFAQLQNRTGTVCTRRTRISWIQSHHLAKSTTFQNYTASINRTHKFFAIGFECDDSKNMSEQTFRTSRKFRPYRNKKNIVLICLDS